MKQYYLKIFSKNEKSLKNFLAFLLKHLKTKFSIIKKPVVKRNYKKVITLLKSPHVNKTAQEHFELRIFSKKILLNSFYTNKNLIFLKKKLNRLFQDVSIIIETNTNARIGNKNRKLAFHLDSFKFSKNKLYTENIERNKQKASLAKTPLAEFLGFLNMISIFGEFLVNNKKYLNSSVVEQRVENPCGSSSNLLSDKLSMKNYLCNMLASIKNGQLSKRNVILQKRKNICEALLKILWSEGFILGYVINKKNTNQIKILLKYVKSKPVIHSIKFLSKPSRRLHYSIKQIWKIDSNKSFVIFSTNQGLKSVIECKKLKIGGEPFVSIN